MVRTRSDSRAGLLHSSRPSAEYALRLHASNPHGFYPMRTRPAIALLLCACVPSFAIGQNPPARVHHDLGYHTGWIHEVFFRQNAAKQLELVSICLVDRSIRLWTVPAQPNVIPRCISVMFLPDYPQAIALHPSGKYLACAFDGIRPAGPNPGHTAIVRIIDLDAAQQQIKPYDVKAVEIPLDHYFDATYSARFSPDGDTLLVGGDVGSIWIASQKNWNQPVAIKPVQVSQMKEGHITAIAFSGDGTQVAVACKVYDQATLRPPAVVYQTNRNAIDAGKWEPLMLEGKDPMASTSDWASGAGLAVGYRVARPDGLAEAMVTVFPPQGGKPLTQSLGIGLIEKIRWVAEANPRTLSVAMKRDSDASFLPRFVSVDWEKNLIQESERPPLQNAFAQRRGNGTHVGGLTACASADLQGTTVHAFATAARGDILLARGDTVRELGRDRSEPWITYLGWDETKNKLLLGKAGGLRIEPGGLVKDKVKPSDIWVPTPTSIQIPVDRATLWATCDLKEPGKPVPQQRFVYDAVARSNPQYCVVPYGKWWVGGDPRGLGFGPDNTKVLPKVQDYSPSVRDIIAFEKSNTVISLGNDGGLYFWTYNKQTNTLDRVATAFYSNDELHFVNSAGEASTDPRGLFQAWRVGDDLIHAVLRFDYDPQAFVNLWMPRIPDLRDNTELPPGLFTFAVEAPGDGQIAVRVGANKPEMFNIQAGESRPVTVDLKGLGNKATREEIHVEFLPVNQKLPQPAVATRSVWVRPVGKVVILAIVPQSPATCTDQRDPQDPQGLKILTVTKLATLLRKLRPNDPVEVKFVATAGEAKKEAKQLANTLSEYDCVILFYKGHTLGAGNNAGPVLLTDDTNWQDNGAILLPNTGIDPPALIGLLSQVTRATRNVQLILDTCHAGQFEPHIRDYAVNALFCALPNSFAEALLLPTAIDLITNNLNRLSVPPGKHVFTGSFIQSLRDACREVTGDARVVKPNKALKDAGWGLTVLNSQNNHFLGRVP